MSELSTTGPLPPRANHEHGTGGVAACPICRPVPTSERSPEMIESEQMVVTIDPEPDGLVYTTPSGRVWNPETWLWEEPAAPTPAEVVADMLMPDA